MAEILLDTGKVPFVLKFVDGDSETIYFNPTDFDLAEKIAKLPDIISEKTKEYKDVGLNLDGTPKNLEDIEDYTAMKKIVYDEIDNVFDFPVCEKVCKHCSMFAFVKGKMFFEQFLRAISPEIKKEIDKARKEFDKEKAKRDKVNEHIGEYVNND